MSISVFTVTADASNKSQSQLEGIAGNPGKLVNLDSIKMAVQFSFDDKASAKKALSRLKKSKVKTEFSEDVIPSKK